MARSDFWVVSDVAVEDIMLDVRNARIRAGSDQNDCIRRILRKRDQFLAICESIAKDGLTTMPILASPNEDGTYTVKDGNRRTTALKLLNNPTLCPELELVPRIAKIAATNKNFPSRVDLTVTKNEQIMISEVLSRHQGEMAGIGQMGWSAYLRTLYLLNHGHPAEYKRPGQYALWAEGQGIFVDDEFPITNLQRFFTIENLQMLGFEIGVNDELSLNLPQDTVRQIATKVVGDFGGGKSVNEVFTPDQAKQYINAVRISAGLPAPTSTAIQAPTGNTPSTTSSTSPTNSAPPAGSTGGASPPLAMPAGSTPPPRASATPATSVADRKKVFGTRSPNIAIPATGYPKEQTLVAELRALDLGKFPLAATMLTRALLELSDLHYRTTHALQDQGGLSKNIKKSVQHMLTNGKVSASEADIVKRLCNQSGAMIEIETIQKMVHRNTHNLDRQFVNTLWDNIVFFVRACWA
jgi:ParB-like nuclease domain